MFMKKLVVLILALFLGNAYADSHSKSVVWVHPTRDANDFEDDKSSCEIIGQEVAGPKPTYQNIPSCGGSARSMMAGSSCASARHNAQKANRDAKQAWLSKFESGYNSCMFEKGYTQQ